jgi:hypothetical protein
MGGPYALRRSGQGASIRRPSQLQGEQRRVGCSSWCCRQLGSSGCAAMLQPGAGLWRLQALRRRATAAGRTAQLTVHAAVGPETPVPGAPAGNGEAAAAPAVERQVCMTLQLPCCLHQNRGAAVAAACGSSAALLASAITRAAAVAPRHLQGTHGRTAALQVARQTAAISPARSSKHSVEPAARHPPAGCRQHAACQPIGSATTRQH